MSASRIVLDTRKHSVLFRCVLWNYSSLNQVSEKWTFGNNWSTLLQARCHSCCPLSVC